MKKNRKLIILISTVLLLGLIFFMVKKDSNKEYDKDSTTLDKTIEYLLEKEKEAFNDDKRNSIKSEIISIMSKSTDKTILAESNFILGNLYAMEKDNKTAIIKYNEAISYFEEYTNIEVMALTYYELSKLYLSESEYDNSEDIFEKLKYDCKRYGKKALIVKYSLKRGYDLHNIPHGKEQAVKILEDALNLAEEINYDEIEDVYFSLGRAYWYVDRLVDSINAKLEALSVCQSKNLKAKICKISTDIGIDYLFSKEYDEAIVYLSRVLGYKLEDEYEDAKSKSYSLVNLVEAYTRIEDYDSAEKSIKQLEESIEKLEDGTYKEDIKINMYTAKADYETSLGNPSTAIEYLEMAEDKYNTSYNNSFYDLDVEIAEEYGDAYYKMGNYEKALEYHKEMERLAKERDITYLEEDYNEKIYLDYKALGDYDSAMKYLEGNNELKSKKYLDKSRQYYQYLISKFESDKNQMEINKLQQYKDTMRLILLILCGVTMIICVFTYQIYKKNKEINRLNKLFKNLSMTDSLTKIQNRRSLDGYLATNWALYKKTHMPISFIMIDIDYFKKYNDNYGHPEGDLVLEKVAATIKSSCRNLDFVARYGGEEFIIIMLNTSEKDAINLVNRIKKNIYDLNIKHEYSKVSDRLTISVGISTAHVGTNNDYNDYIKKADEALYESKQKGRNTYTSLA